MNVDCSDLTAVCGGVFAQMYVLLVLFTIFAFYHEKNLSQNCKKIFFYQKYVCLGGGTLIHCGRRAVVRVYVDAFLWDSPGVPRWRRWDRTRRWPKR